MNAEAEGRSAILNTQSVYLSSLCNSRTYLKIVLTEYSGAERPN
jgi:hypothetical protein